MSPWGGATPLAWLREDRPGKKSVRPTPFREKVAVIIREEAGF
jgi:hypothetical protein